MSLMYATHVEIKLIMLKNRDDITFIDSSGNILILIATLKLMSLTRQIITKTL